MRCAWRLVLCCSGSNVGTLAVGTFTVSATYGDLRGGPNFSATQCTVLSSSAVSCYSAVGYGTNLQWTVTVAGVTSLASGPSLVTSYSAPNVVSANVSNSLLSTQGGELVVLTGE